MKAFTNANVCFQRRYQHGPGEHSLSDNTIPESQSSTCICFVTFLAATAVSSKTDVVLTGKAESLRNFSPCFEYRSVSEIRYVHIDDNEDMRMSIQFVRHKPQGTHGQTHTSKNTRRTKRMQPAHAGRARVLASSHTPESGWLSCMQWPRSLCAENRW